MRVCLKELVDVNLTPEELGKILTIAGFELEQIIDLHGNADGIPVSRAIGRSHEDT